jgi:type I restriction enzyme S subunit
LKDITNALGDGIHSTPNYVQNSEFYFINGNNLRNGSIVITQKTKMVAQTEYQKYKLDLNENTVLLSINGTIGNLSFYRNEKVILGKSACYINSNNKLNVEFLFYLLQSNLIKNYFRKELTKTSIPNLSLKSVRMAPIALPPLPIQKQIVQNIKIAEEKFKSQKTQFENIKENYENSITYVNHIQSSILDTAFSGKLVQ